jgi:hypothetical protein
MSALKGRAFSPNRATNQLYATMHPASFCMLCSFAGFPIVSIAWIFSGFVTMPLDDTRNPRSYPADMPKEHFVGLSLSL